MDLDEVLDNVGRETDSVVEAVDRIDEEKADDKGKSENKPAEKNPQESNGGWLTQLPKELREGIDPKITSLAEYIQYLRANQKGVEDESANEGSWEGVLEAINAEGYGEGDKELLKGITEKMKDEGVKPKSGMKSIRIFVEEQEKARKLSARKREDDAERYVSETWSKDAERNIRSFENGLRVLKGIDPSLIREVKERRLSQSPAFIEAVRALGERTSEKTMSSGGRPSDKDAFDPMNPLKL